MFVSLSSAIQGRPSSGHSWRVGKGSQAPLDLPSRGVSSSAAIQDRGGHDVRLPFISPPLPSSFLSSMTADAEETLVFDRVSLLALFDKYQCPRAIKTVMHVLGPYPSTGCRPGFRPRRNLRPSADGQSRPKTSGSEAIIKHRGGPWVRFLATSSQGSLLLPSTTISGSRKRSTRRQRCSPSIP